MLVDVVSCDNLFLLSMKQHTRRTLSIGIYLLCSSCNIKINNLNNIYKPFKNLNKLLLYLISNLLIYEDTTTILTVVIGDVIEDDNFIFTQFNCC